MQKHSQKQTLSWHQNSVKGHGNSLSYMCAATNKATTAVLKAVSSLCEIRNTDGLDRDEGETASHHIKYLEYVNSNTCICQIGVTLEDILRLWQFLFLFDSCWI